MSKNKKVRTTAYLLIMCLLLCSCGSSAGNSTASANTGFIVTKAGMYDSADENAVIVSKNSKDKTITLYNRLVKRNYTLNYDGTSKLYDKYGDSLSMEQIEEGQIVNITFLKDKKLLNSLQLSDTAWTVDETSEFEIDEKAGTITLATGVFNLSDNLLVYTDDKQAELMDVNSVDTITVRGVDRVVNSITVDRGHGYLRLSNEEYFVGGWIEVGSKIIRTIGEDMLIAVPEGSYDVMLSQGKVEDSLPVTITRNQETNLDLSVIEVEEPITYGTLIIVTNPDTAEIYIDGEEQDKNFPIKVEYGIHQLIARADGYETLTQYIKVGQESATLELSLEKNASFTDTSTHYVTASPSPTPIPVPTSIPTEVVTAENTSKTVSGYKITVATPTDAEVYLDGSYIGISPISFAKTTGNHEIILRKDGFVTRSYTISVDGSEQDETFSFSDLQEKE